MNMDDSSHCSSECYHLKALEDLLNDKETKLEELRTQLNDVQEKCEVYKRECEQLNLELQAQKIDLRDRMRLTRDAQNQTNATDETCKCKSTSLAEAHTQTFETDFNHVDSAGTLDWQPAEGQTIADMVKEAAITAQKSDFVYDEKSKMYYSASTGYYYDSNRQLFYEPYSKIYYSYDEESKSYKFHSQINEDGVVVTVKEEGKSRKKHKSHRKSKKHRRRGESSEYDDSPPRRSKKKKSRRKSGSSDSLEDGEVDSSDGSSVVCIDSKKNNKKKFEVIDLDENSCDADSLPPSMRLIVQSSESLKLGTLLLVTYNGGTVGRNENFEVCIPDSSISRMHARIDYDSMGKKYQVQDLGSQNGTRVNEVRLSEPKNTSDPYTLKHGNTLRFGDCIFKVHIHSGHNTCADCEPGLVQAAVLASQAIAYQQDEPVIILSKDEKEKVRKEQMKLMKKKYGLSSADYEPVVDISGYTDRAKDRRITKGSDNPYEKDAEPTSVDKPIAEDNKGFKMLSSMGWSRGQALGHSKTAILEPVNPDFQFDRAGLGARTNYID